MSDRASPAASAPGGERGAPEQRGQDYALLSLVGLLFVTVVLVQEGLDWWAALPLGAGALGVLLPGAVSPSLVLFAVMTLLVIRFSFFPAPFVERPVSSPLADLLLALASLAYLAGHTRYLSIRRHAVPPDPRRERLPGHERLAGRWLLPHKPTRRSGEGVATGEVARLLLAAPLFALVAYMLWVRVAFEPVPETLELPLPLYRAVLVVWAGVIALCGGYALLAYLGRANASREESLMYLQDQLWDATRGEQRRVHRWLARSRLRRQQKEDGR
jgi:hypothetical protein